MTITRQTAGRIPLQRGAAALAALVCTVALAARAPQSPAMQCRPEGTTVRVAALPEGSGAASSRRHTGRVWSHNDSGKPLLIALDDRGATIGQVELRGVKIEDWEALAVGPCPNGSCLYVGDIGDNDAERPQITVYRLPEPDAASGSVEVPEAFHAKYPDGPHDAEALLVTPRGDLFIVTKGETGPVGIYRFPRDLKSGATVTLEPVGGARTVDRGERITDGSVSPDGSRVALRTTGNLQFYAAAELTAGTWRDAGRVALTDLGEPQGEGVAFATDTTLYLVGEGGGKSQPGTFARLTCTR